ncbi:MAG: YdcF family protein [Niabella sp.]
MYVTLLALITVCFFASCVSYRKRPQKLYHKVVANAQIFDAGIVPGIGFYNNQWDTVMKGRVLWATALYKQGIIRNIIFSGGAVYTPYYEAKIMGLYARELGVPGEHIFYETKAEHSTENIFYAYQIARQQGFKSIALVTDPFQSSMLKRFTKKHFKTTIVHLPFLVDTLKRYNHLEPVINPASTYMENFKSIEEREGRWRRLRGTLGAFIPWESRSKREREL